MSIDSVTAVPTCLPVASAPEPNRNIFGTSSDAGLGSLHSFHIFDRLPLPSPAGLVTRQPSQDAVVTLVIRIFTTRWSSH